MFVLFLYVFNIFSCHCSVCLSVCLVLWASLPEIKTDDDDDDDDDELRVRTGRTELAARCDGFGELSERTESDVVLRSDLELVLRAGAQRDHLVPPAPPCQHTRASAGHRQRTRAT